MKNLNEIKELASHLAKEINWVEQLNDLLSEEKNILTTRQFSQLDELAVKKQALSNQLEDSSKQRKALIENASSNNPQVTSFNELLQTSTTIEFNQINELSIKLAQALTHCRELNTINGQVIASNIYNRQEIINIISGNQTEVGSIYTANGSMSSSNKTNHHQEA